MNLHYLPVSLGFALGIQGSVLSVFHLESEFVENRQQVLETLGSLFGF